MKRNETELRSSGCPQPCLIWETLMTANGSGIKAGLGVVRGSYHLSVARWPCSSQSFPPSCQCPEIKTQSSPKFFNLLLWHRDQRRTFVQVVKEKPGGNLMLSLPPLYFLRIKDTPLKGLHRETYLNQGLVSAPHPQGHSGSCTYVPGGATWETGQPTQQTDGSLGGPQSLWSWKKKINLIL